MIVSVIGAGGHIGLPFSLVCADAGHTVHGIDINQKVVEHLNQGIVPYVEHGAVEILNERLRKNLWFTTDTSKIAESNVIAVMIGTPVDEEQNPRLDDIFDFVDSTLVPNLGRQTLIILRSTVSPGTTELVIDRIERKLGWKEGEDFYLAFAPERVLQTKGIEETKKLPVLIGATNVNTYTKAAEFFRTFASGTFFHLTPREAEVAKLMTNMYRYVNFAFANEMWMIGEKQNVNIHKVIQAANYGYERMAVPLPGPNVGGPCLFKDGRFLLSDIPFVDLIQTSFIINEGMPDYIWSCISKINPTIKKVLILGAGFKANCDDTRNSLSYKMKKVCKKHGAEANIWDLYSGEVIEDNPLVYDAVILMTPHSDTPDIWSIDEFRSDCVIVDIWKLYYESAQSASGIYKAGDVND